MKPDSDEDHRGASRAHASFPGVLVLVAGPSGSGKDSILRQLRTRFRDRREFVFPRRVVTRPPGDDSEDHEAVTDNMFEALQRQGAFALSWRAHGLSYGVPATVKEDLAAGRVVIVNVSRTIIGDAARVYPNLRTVLVTASKDVLAARLAARGREEAAEIACRISREVELPAQIPGALVIENDGRLEDAVETFARVLEQTIAPLPPPKYPERC